MSTTKDASAYEEGPLDRHQHEIRLLQVSRTDSGDIKCNLEVHSIENCPEFLALSYVWGPPEMTQTILLDGRNHTVRQYLFLFLQMLVSKRMGTHLLHCTAVKSRGSPTRGPLFDAKDWFMFCYGKHLKSPLLWIDALCINQYDYVERSHQVALMANIYTIAKGVMVWLGPSSPSTRLAYSFIRAIGSERLLKEGKADSNWNDPPSQDIVSLMSHEY